MNGTRWLYISNDFKVYRVPKPKNHVYKSIRELAGQEVLRIILYFEIKERNPFKLLLIEFERITLDLNGGYQLLQAEMSKALYNFFEFGLTTPEELAEKDTPLAIPMAPVIPTNREKEALYNYLKEKFKPLYVDAPYIMEMRINSLKKIHKEYIDLVKQAMKLK
ncbi:hypothetical protein ABU162_04990 [Paenibacillus thiaminolyticus]|uniref:hypothetical protein n=1 Tax=Paenibacillus thiaminolyticus TaxID=49283 RepID=UPI0035A5B059